MNMLHTPHPGPEGAAGIPLDDYGRGVFDKLLLDEHWTISARAILEAARTYFEEPANGASELVTVVTSPRITHRTHPARGLIETIGHIGWEIRTQDPGGVITLPGQQGTEGATKPDQSGYQLLHGAPPSPDGMLDLFPRARSTHEYMLGKSGHPNRMGYLVLGRAAAPDYITVGVVDVISNDFTAAIIDSHQILRRQPTLPALKEGRPFWGGGF